jgi:hypothetical protein
MRSEILEVEYMDPIWLFLLRLQFLIDAVNVFSDFPVLKQALH